MSDTKFRDPLQCFFEFIFGGDPLAPSSGVMPEVVGETGGSWSVEYDRADASIAIPQFIEYSYDLEQWFEVLIPETSAGNVTVTPGSGTDRVRVTIPASGSGGFVRFRATR